MERLFFLFRESRTRNMADDESDILTVVTDVPVKGPAKRMTDGREKQLAAAREKAMASRKLAQKSKLERKLQEVKLAIGDLDGAQTERAVKYMVEQERELRHHQRDLTERCIDMFEKLDSKVSSIYAYLAQQKQRAHERTGTPLPPGVSSNPSRSAAPQQRQQPPSSVASAPRSTASTQSRSLASVSEADLRQQQRGITAVHSADRQLGR